MPSSELIHLFIEVPQNHQDLMAWLISVLIAIQLLSVVVYLAATLFEVVADKTGSKFLAWTSEKLKHFAEAARGF